MGRTKRKRLRKCREVPMGLYYDEHTVKLQKWMSGKGWKNCTKLTLKLFPDTGRGVRSKITIRISEVLLSLPLDIMITYNTIKLHIPIKNVFTIHESLAIFLVIEKEKGIYSYWRDYIMSLPEKLPPLTWLANDEELQLFPFDLRQSVDHSVSNFNIFADKVKKFILNGQILDKNLLKWAYVMVNTRAVYIDPQVICEDPSFNILKDEPSMALCPFLDMFNHNYSANTEAYVVKKQNSLFYELKTLTFCKKYDQIFISYGSHDNIKLLTEYGFFIPKNYYDVINFTIGDVLKTLNFNLDHIKYKFIVEHDFHNNLYIGYDGPSYSLKTILFIICSQNLNQLNSIIFSGNYPKIFLETQLPHLIKQLLEFKKTVFSNDLTKLSGGRIVSDSAQMVLKFLEFRVDFLNNILKSYR